MPRNASGTYSLPSGNPVSSGTLIDATWANNTLNDIANEMTDSLSRSGEGGMLAPFRLNDGVQATPGLAFTNEPSTGMYRAGTNEAWLVAGGTQVLQFTTTGAMTRYAPGAVATPSITAMGDLNTGLWFPAADTLALSTNGVERLRVGSGGDFAFDTNVLFVDATNNRVGVGTITPAVALDVNGGLSIQSANNLTWGGAYGATTPAISGAAGFLAFYPNGSTSGEIARLTSTGLGIGTASPGGRLHITTASGNTEFVHNVTGSGTAARTSYQRGGVVQFLAGLGAWSGTDTYQIASSTGPLTTIDSSGNLGIGTTSPGTLLDLGTSTGQKLSLYRNANIRYGFGIETDTLRYYVPTGASNAVHSFGAISTTDGTTYTERMRLDTSGNLGIGTTSPSYKLDVRGGVLSVGNGTIFGGISYSTRPEIGAISNHPVGFITNNITQMLLDTSGNLGIGTTSPGAKLDVYANANASNTILLRNADTNTANFGTQAYYRLDIAGNHIGGLKTTARNLAGLSTPSLYLTTSAAYPIAFGLNDSATPSMLLDSSGNLGIGTTSPVVKLAVSNGGAAGFEFDPATGITQTYNRSGAAYTAYKIYGLDLEFRAGATPSIAMTIDSNRNIVAGASAALATTATNGFLYVPTCAGVPTGTPTSITGMVPIVVDTTNNRWYFYSGGAWRNAGP